MIDVVTKLKRACDRHKIYLYGAGMYGRMLYAFMQEQEIGHIEKFIVSKVDGDRTVLGQEVITLEEYVVHKAGSGESAEEDLIIIAVSEKYTAEIVKQLEHRELCHYLTFVKEAWDVIDNAVLFEGITLQKNIAVLMYHRVIDSRYNFWKLNVSPETFEKHIKYISENYKVLRLEEEWDSIVEAGQKYVVITFDDGYVDNYQFALPILEKYHVPATIFVSTGLMDTDEMYWWDELEKIFMIDNYIGEFTFDGVLYKIIDSNDREKACIAIRNNIKNMNLMEQRNSMGKLRSVLGLEQSYTSELRCVNTSEFIKMAASPYITIGGHTKSHLSMGSMHSKEILRSEIEESQAMLEKKIGKKIEVFAYPFGGKEDCCDIADQIIAGCGVKKTVLVKNGNVSISDEMYNIPRHMVFEGEDMEKKMGRIWGIYG